MGGLWRFGDGRQCESKWLIFGVSSRAQPRDLQEDSGVEPEFHSALFPVTVKEKPDR